MGPFAISQKTCRKLSRGLLQHALFVPMVGLNCPDEARLASRGYSASASANQDAGYTGSPLCRSWIAVHVCQMWASREYCNNNGGVVPIWQMTRRQLEGEVQRFGEVQKRLIAEASTVRRHRDIFQRRWLDQEVKVPAPSAVVARASLGCQ